MRIFFLLTFEFIDVFINWPLLYFSQRFSILVVGVVVLVKVGGSLGLH